MAGGIILLAFGGLGVYLWSRKVAAAKRAEKRAADERRGIEVEHAACDVHRLFLVEKRLELARTQNDPLREGNLRGEIARGAATLKECERIERRNEAAE